MCSHVVSENRTWCHDFSMGMAMLRALCVYSTERREGLTHGTSLGISCLPGWRLCHQPLEVGM